MAVHVLFLGCAYILSDQQEHVQRVVGEGAPVHSVGRASLQRVSIGCETLISVAGRHGGESDNSGAYIYLRHCQCLY